MHSLHSIFGIAILADPAKAARLVVDEVPSASEEVGQTHLGALMTFH